MIWIKPDNTLVRLPGKPGVVAWLPSEAIVFRSVVPPKTSRKIWEKSVPYMLEESLIAAPEDQHFVFGKLTDDKRLPVAVVSREKMDYWLGLLNANKFRARVMCPDLLAVPYTKGGMVLWHERGRALLRTGQHQGMAGSIDWIAQMLERSEVKSEIQVFSDEREKLPPFLQDVAEVLPGPLTDKMKSPDAAPASLNFLQGSYLPASPVKNFARPWMRVAACAPLAFLLYISNLKVETDLTRQQEPVVRAATQELVSFYYPNIKVSGNLRRELGKRLAQAREGISFRENSIWPALLQAETVISNCRECRVESMRMTQKKVSITFSSSTPPTDVASKLKDLPGFETKASTLPDFGERRRMKIDISASDS